MSKGSNLILDHDAVLKKLERISHQIIGEAVANNKVEIKSGYYNLGSGVVDFLD